CRGPRGTASPDGRRPGAPATGGRGRRGRGRSTPISSEPSPPYHWHVNDGEDVFAVLDGRVEMCVKENGHERSVVLETGDVFFASAGTEHVARQIGEARVLVDETAGSV